MTVEPGASGGVGSPRGAGAVGGSRVFTNPRRPGIAAAVSLTLAGILILGALLVFVGLLVTPPTDASSMLPGMLGGVMVFPLFLLGYGIVQLRSPLRATIDDEGLSAEWLIARKRLAWSQIARLRRDKLGPLAADSIWKPAHKRSSQDVLVLLDDRGKELARLTSALADFPALVAEIEARSSMARGTPTYDRGAQVSARRARARRNSRLTAALGLLMAALSVVVGVMSLREHRAGVRLDREAVPAEARIVRHYLYNVTPRLEYAFKDAAGAEHTNDVVLTREAWDRLTGRPSVEVQYVPAQPDLNRPVRGEVKAQNLPLPLAIAGMAILGTLGLLMITAPLLGIADIKIKDGRLRIVRFNQLGDDLEDGPARGTAAAAAAPLRPIVPTPAAAMAEPRRGPPGGGIVAMGVLNLLFGLAAAAIDVLRLAAILWLSARGGSHVIDTGTTSVEVTVEPFGVITGVIGTVLGLLLLVSGIALLLRKRWGRTLALIAATGQCLLGLALLAHIYITPPLPVLAEEGSQATPISIEQIVATGMILATMIYPAVVLAVLGRRSVRERLGANSQL